MKKILKKIYERYQVLTTKKTSRFYNIDGFMLDMGENHNLSLIQKKYLMYDKFTPFLGVLADKCVKSGWIIDVGANVGDTVAGMIRHTNQSILCVEPTKKFFDLCKKNIEMFGVDYSERVKLTNAYIALNLNSRYYSDVNNGTAVKVESKSIGEAPTYTLEELLKVEKISLSSVSLVKVDTDGYDSECIMSIGSRLKDVAPLLYWENQIDTDGQFDLYLQMINYLKSCGYIKFFVFDNFGNYLCELDYKGVVDINNYLHRIIKGRSALTFYYVDILACKEEQIEICKSVIDDYIVRFS